MSAAAALRRSCRGGSHLIGITCEASGEPPSGRELGGKTVPELALRRTIMDTLENAHRRGSRSLELAGKTAVVTGAASGIGRAIAIELATAGADVLVHTRGRQELLAEVCDLVRQLGCKSQLLLADFADQSAVESFADRSWQWQSGIDIWVNNAGADVLTPPHGDLSFADKLALLWKVDVQGTILLSRAIGRRMRDHGRGGVIVNLGWDQAETGMAGDSGELFAATKAAVMAFSRSLAKSLAPAVRVNCVAPVGSRRPGVRRRRPRGMSAPGASHCCGGGVRRKTWLGQCVFWHRPMPHLSTDRCLPSTADSMPGRQRESPMQRDAQRMPRSKIHFVTGKLAADALRETVQRFATVVDFTYSIQVLPITVAALMTADWMRTRVHAPPGTTHVMLPGYCRGDLKALEAAWQIPVERGPRDLRALPDFFGEGSTCAADYGRFDVEIIAEINHAPQLFPRTGAGTCRRDVARRRRCDRCGLRPG